MTKEVNVPLDWRKVNLGDCFIEGKKSHIKVDDATGFGSYPFLQVARMFCYTMKN